MITSGMTPSISCNVAEEKPIIQKFRERRLHRLRKISFGKKTEWDIELPNCHRKRKSIILMTQIRVCSPNQTWSQRISRSVQGFAVSEDRI